MACDLQATDREAWRRWFAAAGDPAIDEKLRALCEYVDAQTAARDVVCWASGQCCRFDEFGHRLYVTALEAAWVVCRVNGIDSGAGVSPAMGDPVQSDGGRDAHPTDETLPTSLPLFEPAGPCAFQRGRSCAIHAIRPMACRVFFCQQGDEAAQQLIYEHVQREIKALHDAHDLPYRYMEWRAALAEAVGQASA